MKTNENLLTPDCAMTAICPYKYNPIKQEKKPPLLRRVSYGQSLLPPPYLKERFCDRYLARHVVEGPDFGLIRVGIVKIQSISLESRVAASVHFHPHR